MAKYFFYVALFILSATTVQCNKNGVDAELPPETQTGAGTFACKINGVSWQYKDPNYEFLSTKPKTRWSFDPNDMGGYFYIGALRYADGSNANDLIVLQGDSLKYFKEKTVNNFDGYNAGVKYINYDFKNGQCYEYRTTNALDTTKNYYSSGKLTITKLDQTAKIISGNFYCTIKQNGCDTLKITDGRFDLKY